MQQFLELDTSSSIVGRVLRIREHMHLSTSRIPSSNSSESVTTDVSLSQQEHAKAVKQPFQVVEDPSYRCASGEGCFVQAWEKLSIHP